MLKVLLLIIATLISNFSYANSNTSANLNGYDPVIFLWLVIFIVLSRFLSIVKKFGLPLVVGEILSGVILGELHVFGFNMFKYAETDSILRFLAEFGAIILMFEIGLDSKFSDLKKNIKKGSLVAISGTIITLIGGFCISEFLIPYSNLKLNMLIGIILAATATGISAKTFKEIGIIRTKEVQIVLVSSIVDELISIICFGVISSLILDATVNITNISTSIVKVVFFFVFAAIFGNFITPYLAKFSIRIHAGINMKIGLLLTICFLFSWISYELGLATIIGSFIAGLILDQVYFSSFSKSNFFIQLKFLKSQINDTRLKYEFTQLIHDQEDKALEELLKPLAHVFVPIFFIYIGILLDIHQLINPLTFKLTFMLIIISFTGRILSGYFVRDKTLNRLILGLGMTPIGEAGLIFAMFGRSTNLINDTVFSAIVSALVIAAILTPILIKLALKLQDITYE